MGASDKPTIEGFVVRLLEENHIKSNETITVQNTLYKATEGMSSEEKSMVIRNLNKKLDATSNDLITSHGLNFASLEKAVETVSTDIKKEKQNKIEDEKNRRQALEEEIDIKKEEIIKEDIKKIDKWIKGLGDIDPSMLSDEFKQKIAHAKVKNDGYERKFTSSRKKVGKKTVKIMFSTKEVRELEEEQSDFEAVKETLGPNWEEKLEDGPSKYEMMLDLFGRIFEESEKKEKSPEEVAEDILKNDKSFRTVALKFSWKREKEYKGLSFFKWMTLHKKMIEIKEEKAVMASHDRRLEEYDDGKLKSVSELKGIIERREKVKREYRESKKKCNEITGREIYPEVEKKNEELCNEIVETYIKTGRTISNIYEELRLKGKTGELDFDDILDGVKENLERDADKVGGKEAIEAFIKHERKCRDLDLLVTEYERIEKNSEKTEDRQILNEQKINYEKKLLERERLSKFEDKDFRKILCKKRNLENTNAYKPNVGKVIEEKRDLPPLSDMLENMNAIIEDRNEIIRISEREGITTDEALQKYLSENEDFLDRYTEDEKRLMGITGVGLKNTDFLTRLTYVLNGKMYNYAECLNYEIRMADKKLEWSTGEERVECFKEIEILKEKLSATKDNQTRLENDNRQQISKVYSRREDREMKENNSRIMAEKIAVEERISEPSKMNQTIAWTKTTFDDMQDVFKELTEQVNDRDHGPIASEQQSK